MARILIITQVFYPDTAATAQHLIDLAISLRRRGHEVTAFTSRFSYENPNIIYPKIEQKEGIYIHRIRNTGWGKRNILTRVLDFLSFNLLLLNKLCFTASSDFDIMLGMTSPPLVSFIGILIAKWKKWKFYYWTMDLQPELSIQSGLMEKDSLVAKVFTKMGDYIFKHSDKIIVLDRYMAEHIINRGASKENISMIPVWPVMDRVYEGDRLANPYRKANQFGEKIVIMYSGNHSYVHPLDTILESAKICATNEKLLFVFVGEGVRKKEVIEFRKKHQLNNIVSLPYEPRNNIYNSLGASDFQLVILGAGQVGYTHPNKIYGAMFIGKPFIYIGPPESHIADIAVQCPGNISVRPGDSKLLAEKLMKLANDNDIKAETGKQNREFALKHFNPDSLREKMASLFD